MIKEKNMYKPLPESLTIKQSGINGLGLFADQKVMQGTNFGVSHYKLNGDIIRTPLGGFINHSNTPNVVKIELQGNQYKKWNLVTLKDIEEGEEVTIRYTFYNV